MIFACLFSMTMTAALQNRVSLVHDYYMPGRDEIEPGTNALNGGRNEAANGDPAIQAPEAAAENNVFGPDGMAFSDLLDVLNPLQHLPVIADLYRAVTGDEISPGARLAGGALYGGPLGFLAALANTVVAEATGKDIGGNVLALFSGDGDADSSTLTAEAAAPNMPVKLAGANPGPVPGDKAKSGVLAADANAIVPLAHLASVPPPPGPDRALINGGPDQQGKLLPASGPMPELSPAAFQTLLRNVNGEAPGGKPQGLAAGAEMPPVYKGSIRDAGLEINRLLRPHAERRN